MLSGFWILAASLKPEYWSRGLKLNSCAKTIGFGFTWLSREKIRMAEFPKSMEALGGSRDNQQPHEAPGSRPPRFPVFNLVVSPTDSSFFSLGGAYWENLGGLGKNLAGGIPTEW